jgi:hypothetical protein
MNPHTNASSSPSRPKPPSLIRPPANPSSRSPAGGLATPDCYCWNCQCLPSIVPGKGVVSRGEEGVGDGLTKRSGRRRSTNISPAQPERKKRSPGTGSANNTGPVPPLASQHGWWCNSNTQGSLQIGLDKDSRSPFPCSRSPSPAPFLHQKYLADPSDPG